MLKTSFSRTGLIVLLSLVFVAGVGTAYAGIVLPTITLGGNVEVVGDLKFLDDQTSVKFPATSLPNQPMIEMFSSGTNNADRTIIAHSPSFSTWGLEYRDVGDEFVFTTGGNDRMTVGMTSGDVDIEGDLTTGGDIFCPNCILGFYDVQEGSSVTQEEENNPGSTVRVAHCDVGDIAVSAGYFYLSNNHVEQIRSNVNDGSVSVFARNVQQGEYFEAKAVCADYEPVHVQ